VASFLRAASWPVNRISDRQAPGEIPSDAKVSGIQWDNHFGKSVKHFACETVILTGDCRKVVQREA
jgi:hypothetical protein